MGKWVIMGAACLFALIGALSLFKSRGSQPVASKQKETPVVFIPKTKTEPTVSATVARPSLPVKGDFPEIDRVFQLFTTGPSKLPIVETVRYASSVPWLKGRPAWIADYAVYYNTSRHFIARSLNGKPDYLKQTVSEKKAFNVFKKDKKIHFHLLVDLSLCKMAFYYLDLDTQERVLLKTYSVGVGRLDPHSPSGCLTPTGHFKLGSKVATYQPEVKGFYQGQEVEMMRVFGTRWMPILLESETETLKKGYGLQGAPWDTDSKTGEWIENQEGIGGYSSDGCIRLKAADIEELFAIILTKPTFVDIVKDFHVAKLPGTEVAVPSR